MTTAHRPTFYNALGGENQGGNLIVAHSTRVCARDLPGQTSLKTRQPQPAPLYSDDYVTSQNIVGDDAINNGRKEILKRQLESKEKQHQIQKQRVSALREQPLEAIEVVNRENIINKISGALLPDQEVNPFPEDADDEGPNIPANKDVKTSKRRINKTSSEKEKSLEQSSISDDESDNAATGSENSSEDEEDDEELELMRELEKIKREREEEEIKKCQEEQKKQDELDRHRVLTANPLLMFDASGGDLKRRWDDDVVFKNQAKDIPKPKKRFINDTVRSEFHKKFLAKYIH